MTHPATPSHHYTSASVFRTHVQRVIRPGWQLACHESEIPAPGDYVCVDLTGEPVVVVRDDDGRVRALSRICRHRYAPVVSGAGHCRRFQCPYHLWSYALSGELVAAPGWPDLHREPGRDDRAPRPALAAFAVEVWSGLVFVNVDGAAPPLAPQLAGLDRRLAPFRLAQMRVVPAPDAEAGDRAGVTSQWPVSWKAFCDGFMDTLHQISIHPDTVEPYAPHRLSQIEPSDGPYHVIASTLTERGRRSPYAQHPGPPVELLVHIFPTCILAVGSGNAQIFQLEIQRCDAFALRTVVALLPEVWCPATGHAIYALADEVLRADRELLCRVQRALAAAGSQTGVLIPDDDAIRHFDAYIAQRLESGAQR